MNKIPSIAVIIAAYNAEATIARAIKSALREPEVSEVVVVDDASTDATTEVARRAGDGDPRLRICKIEQNRGPSAARNRGIFITTAPFVAILDADDIILPGRFGRMAAEPDWDFCADNILFVSDSNELDGELLIDGQSPSFSIDFETFVRANISARNKSRGELGFLKPVMSRAFLQQAGISYQEECRLGEDFLLYTEALGKGARFKFMESCGYAALQRENSLSGRHGTRDLIALLESEKRLLVELSLTPSQKRALQAHCRSVRRKIRHREVLDVKQDEGLMAGLVAILSRPSAAQDIMLDRIARRAPPMEGRRKLATERDFAKLRR